MNTEPFMSIKWLFYSIESVVSINLIIDYMRGRKLSLDLVMGQE
jgi:hypothetical protein